MYIKIKKVYIKYTAVYINYILNRSNKYYIKVLILVARLLFRKKVILDEIISLHSISEHIIIYEEEVEKNYGIQLYNVRANAIEVKLPSIGYYEINNVVINSESPILYLVKHRHLARQFFPYPIDQLNIRYNTGNCYGLNGKKHLVDVSYKTVVEKGIMMTGSYNSNWYHWINDILSRAVLWQKLPLHIKKFPIVVPNKCISSKNHFDILKYAFSESEIIGIDGNALIKNCIYIDSPSLNAPNSYNVIAGIEKLSSGQKRHKLLKEYKNIILNEYNKNNKNILQQKKKLFLARKQNKRPYNQDEIKNVLTAKGYETIYLEDMSVDEQIYYFQNAEYIVGPTGAAWTNLLFGNARGALIWIPSCVPDYSSFTKIAQAVGTNLIFMKFPTTAARWSQFMKLKTPYYLDPSMLIKNLESMENKY